MSFKASSCFLFLSFIFVSCSGGGGLNMNPVKYFNSVEHLKGDSVMTLDDYEIYRPTSFAMHGDYIYVQNMDVDVLCAVNRATQEMSVLLKRGEGPGEVLNIAYITTSDDAVVTTEVNKRQIIETSFQTNKSQFTPMPIDYGAFTSIIKGRDGYVLVGNFKEGRYMYYKPSTGKADFFGDYRVQYEYKRFDNFTKSLIYISSKLAIKPDMTRFVAINFNNGVIDINGINQEAIVNLKQLDFHYQEIHVEGSMDNPHVATKRGNKNGFFDVTTSDEYIYAIYSGKSLDEAGLLLDHCDYLMVFDWDGNPVGCYRVNVPLYAICYNKQEGLLYGIHVDEEAILYKFDLSGVRD